MTPRHTSRIADDIQRPTKHHDHAHHFCHYQMAIPSQLLQAQDTILYDTQNHLRHPKKSRSTIYDNFGIFS